MLGSAAPVPDDVLINADFRGRENNQFLLGSEALIPRCFGYFCSLIIDCFPGPERLDRDPIYTLSSMIVPMHFERFPHVFRVLREERDDSTLFGPRFSVYALQRF